MALKEKAPKFMIWSMLLLNTTTYLLLFFSSWLHPSKERIIKIVGDKKMLIFDEMNSNEKIKIYDKKIDNLNKLQSKNYSSQFSFNVGNITIPFYKGV